MGLPIIFMHSGYSTYMEYSLRQVKLTNPDATIVLLGDESNNRFQFITHYNISDYFLTASEFTKIYQHYSTNPYNYELFCFQRWFALNEFMKEQGFKEVFVCDSDVLIYTDLDIYFKKLGKVSLCFCKQENEVASFGISYWNAELLSNFCEYIYSSYSDEKTIKKYMEIWETMQRNNLPGGICDMSIAEAYLASLSSIKTFNLLEVFDDSTFDANFNIANGSKNNEYSFRKNKIITFKNNIPYCLNVRLNRYIRFNALHFQGPAKYKIAEYYKGTFCTKLLFLKYKFAILNQLVKLYKKLPLKLQQFILNRMQK